MDFLDRIVLDVRKTIDSGFYMAHNTEHRHISLAKTMLSNDFSIIPVIERRSPTAAKLFSGSFEDLAILLRNAGAHALSVVCEPTRFSGKIMDITQVKKAGLPVLYKDFVIDPVQIRSAASAGADAVLLIQALFDKGYASMQLNDMIDYSRKLGLETVLEVFSLEEFRKAKETKSDIIGINNRDLRTLGVDISMTQKILKNESCDRPVMAESGIKTRKDIMAMQYAGAKAALVGTSILIASNPVKKLRQLLGD